MADVKLQAVITAKDEASAKVQGMGLSFGKLTAAVGLGNIAANAFQKGISFLTDAMGDSIKAAQEEQVAMVKVDAILKTLKGSFDANKKAVLDNAAAAIKLGFDDEDTAIAMAKLMQVTKDSTQAQDFLNVSMDLARFKNIDLESATQAMTMAMQGSGRILKQLGIDVPDNATKTQILGLVMEKVKGQAEAFGNTAAGAQAKLAVQIENVKEQFGQALLKGITPFVQKLSDWISKPETQKFLQDLADKLGKVLEILLNFTMKNLPKVLEFFNDLQGGWDALTDSISEFIIMWDKAIKKIEAGAKGVAKEPTPFNFLYNQITGKAGGGFVGGGKTYMVGEQGPELFTPSSSGNITPNSKLGANISINFNNPTVRNDNDLSRIITEIKRVLNREQVLAELRI